MPSSWKNAGSPRAYDAAEVQVQRGPNGRRRFRITHGFNNQPALYLERDNLFELVETLDDLCDDVEDGEFDLELSHDARLADI